MKWQNSASHEFQTSMCIDLQRRLGICEPRTDIQHCIYNLSLLVAPPDYKCGYCGATNCKLWRKYQFCSINLLCADCAALDQNEDISDIDARGTRGSNFLFLRRTNQIGWYVPAVPREDFEAWWGLLAIPQDGLKWWERLPTRPDISA